MIFITSPEIEEYIYKLSVPEDPIILEMEKLGHKTGFPIVDRIVGRFLFLITKLKNPGLIVEIGSGFGYSAYWFAKALSNGKVVLTDFSKENIELAKKFFEKGNLIDRAEFHVGDGMEIAQGIKGIDILFLDHQKTKYLEAVKRLEDNLNDGALIIADNTLWHGKVVEENPDRQTKAILEFNEYMFNNERFFSSLIPVRDGILLSYYRKS